MEITLVNHSAVRKGNQAAEKYMSKTIAVQAYKANEERLPCDPQLRKMFP